MTRKHFEAIARALNESWAWADGFYSPTMREQAQAAIADATMRIADVLAESNPRFDRTRFLAAATGAPVRVDA